VCVRERERRRRRRRDSRKYTVYRRDPRNVTTDCGVRVVRLLRRGRLNLVPVRGLVRFPSACAAVSAATASSVALLATPRLLLVAVVVRRPSVSPVPACSSSPPYRPTPTTTDVRARARRPLHPAPPFRAIRARALFVRSRFAASRRRCSPSPGTPDEAYTWGPREGGGRARVRERVFRGRAYALWNRFTTAATTTTAV